MEGGFWIAIISWAVIAVALTGTGLVLHLRERAQQGE